jgi:hypothetical protein
VSARRVLATVATVGAGLGLGASPAAPYGTGDVLEFFRTPSGNIGCAYAHFAGEPASLRCDIGSGLVPLPPRPKDCDLDWGFGYTLGVRGPAQVLCAGDTARDPRARAIAYGDTWRRGGFTCRSRTVWLICRNASGRGFLLSRERSRPL